MASAVTKMVTDPMREIANGASSKGYSALGIMYLTPELLSLMF
jgi:hypothetical protein